MHRVLSLPRPASRTHEDPNRRLPLDRRILGPINGVASDIQAKPLREVDAIAWTDGSTFLAKIKDGAASTGGLGVGAQGGHGPGIPTHGGVLAAGPALGALLGDAGGAVAQAAGDLDGLDEVVPDEHVDELFDVLLGEDRVVGDAAGGEQACNVADRRVRDVAGREGQQGFLAGSRDGVHLDGLDGRLVELPCIPLLSPVGGALEDAFLGRPGRDAAVAAVCAVIAALPLDKVEDDPLQLLNEGLVQILVGVPGASGGTLAGTNGGLDVHLFIGVLDVLERGDETLGLQVLDGVLEDRVVHVKSLLYRLGPHAITASVVD